MLTARVYAWSRRHVVAIDTGVAAVLLLTLGALSLESRGWAGLVFAVLSLAPLAVRRRWPVAVLVFTVVVSLVQVAVLPGVLLPANVGQPIVLFTVAAHVSSFRIRLTALGFGLLGSVLAAVRLDGDQAGPRNALAVAGVAFYLAVFMALVWVVGNLVRGREVIVEELREANVLLEQEREQRDLVAAQRERVRVARDVHDIVAHSLSVVVVQADGAAYAAEHAQSWDRAAAVGALTAIGGTARDALAETRRVVAVLREDDGSDASMAGLGLADLDDLIGSVRAAGLRLTAEVDPVLPDVTDEVGLTAYRVVQEGLTNVLRHAGQDACGRVTVEPVPGGLRVTVSDDGTGAPAEGPGNGLRGMRERVLAAGGQFVAGPRAVGGFAVTATLPAASPARSRWRPR